MSGNLLSQQLSMLSSYVTQCIPPRTSTESGPMVGPTPTRAMACSFASFQLVLHFSDCFAQQAKRIGRVRSERQRSSSSSDLSLKLSLLAETSGSRSRALGLTGALGGAVRLGQLPADIQKPSRATEVNLSRSCKEP